MKDERKTLSMKPFSRKSRKEYAPRGTHEKATVSHESRLKQMMGKEIGLWLSNDSGHSKGILIGYDAFTITIQNSAGTELTYFKHALESFSLVSNAVSH